MLKKLLIIILGGILMFNLFGCSKKEPEVCGGIVDNTDHNAPKEITSHNIISLSTRFYIYNQIDQDLSGEYYFAIKDGKLTYKDQEAEISDEDLLKIDMIVRDENLLKLNGVNRITSGLPPEYQPCSLNIGYDSNESYSYRANNNPEAGWSKRLFELFAQVLNDNGCSDLMPKKEAFAIDHFSIITKIEDEFHFISTYIQGDETLIMIDDEKVKLTDDMYPRLQKVVDEFGLEALHTGKLATKEDIDDNSDYYEIYIDYLSGRQIYGFGKDTSIIEPAIPSIIEIFR